MSPRLLGAFRANDGLLGVAAIGALGLDPNDLRRLVRRREVVRVRTGAYALAEGWEAAGHVGRQILVARAAAMSMRPGRVFSHDTAAHLHGLSFLTPQRPLVHTSEPRYVGGFREVRGVKHHGAPFLPAQVQRTQYGDALDLARTACDLTREHGIRTGLGACDAALRLGVTRTELQAASAAMRSWRGVTQVREAVELADAGADNPAESLARLLVLELGLPAPRTQFPVRVRDSVAWCDLLLGAHVLEIDGRWKYRRVEDGGLARADVGEVVWAERTRERQLIDCGLGVSRVVWAELMPDAWAATGKRIAREYEQTLRRAGPSTPAPLLEFAERMAGQRARRLRAA